MYKTRINGNKVIYIIVKTYGTMLQCGKWAEGGLVCRTPHLPGICCTISLQSSTCHFSFLHYLLFLLLFRKQALTNTQTHARIEGNVTLAVLFFSLIWNSPGKTQKLGNRDIPAARRHKKIIVTRSTLRSNLNFFYIRIWLKHVHERNDNRA